MPKRSLYDDDYEYDDYEYDDYEYDDYEHDDEEYVDTKKGPRKLRQEPEGYGRRKQWDQEREIDRDHNYNERR